MHRVTDRRALRASKRPSGPRRARPEPSAEEHMAAHIIQAHYREGCAKRARDIAGDLAREVGASRVVYMRYTIYSIHAIEAVSRSFHVDFKLEMRLVDLTTVHKRSAQHRVFLNDENLASIPFITIANSIDAEPCEQPIISLDPSDPPGIVRWEQRYRGTIRLIQVLFNFPFDAQELRIVLRTEWYYRRLRPMAGSLNLQERKIAEWTLHEPLPLECYVNEQGRASAAIRVQVSREPAFYIWNVMLINFLLSTLGLIAYGIPVDNLADRVATNFTLLLTEMAFKFTVADLIPKVSYFTLLDWYMFMCFIFLIAIAVENFALTWLHTHGSYTFEQATQVDESIAFFFLLSWLGGQVVLVLFIGLYYVRLRTHLAPVQQLPHERSVGGVYIFPRWFSVVRACHNLGARLGLSSHVDKEREAASAHWGKLRAYSASGRGRRQPPPKPRGLSLNEVRVARSRSAGGASARGALAAAPAAAPGAAPAVAPTAPRQRGPPPPATSAAPAQPPRAAVAATASTAAAPPGAAQRGASSSGNNPPAARLSLFPRRGGGGAAAASPARPQSAPPERPRVAAAPASAPPPAPGAAPHAAAARAAAPAPAPAQRQASAPPQAQGNHTFFGRMMIK